MRAVLTVVGKDTFGILAKVSSLCAEHSINVLEVSQSVLQDLFTMIMLVDISRLDLPFDQFVGIAQDAGENWGLKIHVMHEDIFHSMHRI